MGKTVKGLHVRKRFEANSSSFHGVKIVKMRKRDILHQKARAQFCSDFINLNFAVTIHNF